jgi:hypothetical protein
MDRRMTHFSVNLASDMAWSGGRVWSVKTCFDFLCDGDQNSTAV